MAENPDVEEQLRRLKNTVMGAGHRIALLAGTGVSDQAASELAAVSRDLAEAAQRLERLLARLGRDG